MHHWKKWQRLSPLERRLLLRAWLILPVIVAGLRLFGLRSCQRWLGWHSSRYKAAQCQSEAERVWLLEVAVRLAHVAANRGLVKATCLPRALVLWWLLARSGIMTELRIGVRKSDGEFEAHAWVEYQGRAINDAAEVGSQYQPFASSFNSVG